VSRLRILVEGASEEDFVTEVLAPSLWAQNGIVATATAIGRSSGRQGIVPWKTALRTIRNSHFEDPALYVTTMVDYYAMPFCWPGREGAAAQPYTSRASFMAAKMSEAVAGEMGASWQRHRFIPNVLIHEFETLLFSDPTAVSKALGPAVLETRMHKVLQDFTSPEAINDRRDTCPSQRLMRIYQEENLGHYDKRNHGNIAILEIGLETLRITCPQFGDWLNITPIPTKSPAP
jgi:hypothetical protein